MSDKMSFRQELDVYLRDIEIKDSLFSKFCVARTNSQSFISHFGKMKGLDLYLQFQWSKIKPLKRSWISNCSIEELIEDLRYRKPEFKLFQHYLQKNDQEDIRSVSSNKQMEQQPAFQARGASLSKVNQKSDDSSSENVAQIQQAEDIAIVYEKTKDNKWNRKKIKKFQCKYCLKSNAHRKRILNHQLKCSDKLKKRNELNKFTNEEVQVEISSILKKDHKRCNEEINEVIINEDVCTIEEKFELRIHKIEKLLQKNKKDTIWDRCSLIIQKIIEPIKVILIAKLTSALQVVPNFDHLFDTKQNYFCVAILNKLQNYNFSDIVFDFRSIFLEAHQKLQQNCRQQQKSKRTYRNNQRSYQFLQKYGQIQLLVPSSFYSDLQKEKAFLPIIKTYWKRIKEYHQYLSQFPDIPSIYYQKKQKGSKRSQVTIDAAGHQIVKIFGQNKVLASDMWLVLVLGLRYHDLLRVRFQTSNKGSYFKIIRMIQRKNKHVAARLIPSSLLKLVIASGAIYPITQRRLRAAVHECIKRFGCAYGFKHQILTLILTQLHKSHTFAQMHASSNTTANYYLNQHEEDLIDNVFKLNINFIFDEQVQEQIKSRNHELNLLNDSNQQLLIKKDSFIEVTFDCRVADARIQTDMLDGLLDYKELKSQQYSQTEVFQQFNVSQKHSAELFEQAQPNISSLIERLSSTQDLINLEESISSFNGYVHQQQGYLMQLSQDTKREVYFYSSIGEGQDLSLRRESFYSPQQKIESVPIIISKTKDGYKSTEQKITILRKSTRNSAIIANSYLKIEYQLIKYKPNCFICLKNQLVSKIVFEFKKSFCSQCGWQSLNYGIISDLRKQLYIRSSANDQITGIKSIRPTKRKNNLLEQIQKINRGQYSITNDYFIDIPSQITTKFSKFCTSTVKQIKKNIESQQFLPLYIKLSAIDRAGLGLFCSDKILQDQVVITYRGRYGTNNSIQAQGNNSIWSIGYLRSKDIVLELLVDGLTNMSPARFINSSHSEKKGNLRANIGILSEKQIIVYFSAKRQIQRDEQLQFYYGDKYWEKETQKK